MGLPQFLKATKAGIKILPAKIHSAMNSPCGAMPRMCREMQTLSFKAETRQFSVAEYEWHNKCMDDKFTPERERENCLNHGK